MTAQEPIQRFGALAPRLAEHGYDPVPIIPGKKKPRPEGWQHGGFAKQATQFQRDYTGILTRDCPAVDIDVSDSDLVKQIEVIVMDVAGCHELPPPSRIGNAPRKLLMFRTEEPFEKISTAAYKLSTDPIVNGKPKDSRIEILAAGQQFVAYAIHPDTHQPYQWNGGGEPLTHARTKLPVLDLDQALEIIRRADEMLSKHGQRVGKPKMSQASGDRTPNGKLAADDPQVLRDALAGIPNDDEHFDDWIAMCYAVKGALGDGGLDDFVTWSAKSRKHDAENAVREFKAAKPTLRGAGSIFWLAQQHGWLRPSPVVLGDFVAYMPQHNYIFIPNREIWPASSVDARVPWPLGVDGKAMKPSTYLDRKAPVEQMTWAPGEPMLIKDRLIAGGGWIERRDVSCFNLYQPPQVKDGNPNDVDPWLAHVVRVFGDATDHIIDWLAQRVQNPGVKINHALVLGGGQGIGKDTILEPVRYAVGPWNFAEVSPVQVLGRFNGFMKAVILRVSEARDLGDVDRYAFYDHMKVYTAAPPDVLRCDEKNLREYPVMNCCGVVLTTNHKADGIHLPPDDRRHFVAWSSLTKDDFEPGYWQKLYGWYVAGGSANVAAYLRTKDISGFDPKAPPPQTEAWHEIINANRAPEDAELADLIDGLGMPPALTLQMLVDKTADMSQIRFFLTDRRSRRAVPHRLESAGYVVVRNSAADDGLFKIGGKRQVVYGRRELSQRSRLVAADELIKRGR